ncbi:MAG: phytoene/squalene synthase family protein [Gemmataceae bacterium]|nr:phytoene/squalene synthase family protein [Gemmataceae bacterium]MDW8244446.1 phytoene/squalene synthase family protein [Thermogemmata sp.]
MAASYRYCRRLCRQARSSFPLTFWLLPPHQRRAMQALYAFLRLSDDLADLPAVKLDRGGVTSPIGDDNERLKQGTAIAPVPGIDAAPIRTALYQWRNRLEEALQGRPTHPVHPALVDTLRRFPVSPQWLYAVLEGVAQDVGPVHFRTFSELYAYCWRVAAAVGLACLAVWGLRRGVAWEQAEPLAVAAGIAFQLTNILRDLGEDLQRGRVYLPGEELEAFGCPVESWSRPCARAALGRLLDWQVARARDYYRRAKPLALLLPRRPRAVFRLMLELYQQLLDRVAQAGPDVLYQRIRLRPWHRTLALLRVCAAGW